MEDASLCKDIKALTLLSSPEKDEAAKVDTSDVNCKNDQNHAHGRLQDDVSILAAKIPTKSEIRNTVWLMMQSQRLIKDYPPSCFEKIPNFIGSGYAAERLAKLNEFRSAKHIKVNGSLAQQHVRFTALKMKKTLYVPCPALTTDFLYRVDPRTFTESWHIKRASSKAGAADLGEKITMDNIGTVKLDVVVVASVACSYNGVRLGKGYGYAELEWAILYLAGAVTKKTLVVTTVHDNQVLNKRRMPLSLMSKHDLPVDIIVTPTRVISVRKRLRKPTCGVLWDMLTDERIKEIPILSAVREKYYSQTTTPTVS